MEKILLISIIILSLLSAIVMAYKSIVKKDISILGSVLTRIYLSTIIILTMNNIVADGLAVLTGTCLILLSDIVVNVFYFVTKKYTKEITSKKNIALLSSITDKFYTLLEKSPIGMYIIAEDGRIEYTNQSFSDISGYTREELLGKNILMVVQEDYKELVLENIRKRFNKEFKTMDYTIKGITKTGEIKDIRIISSASENGHFTITGTIIEV